MKAAFLLLLGIFSLPAFGGQAIQRLDQFFAEVHSFEGQFKQTVYDENDEIMQESRGDVALHKPGRFRWQYTQPYPQLILADGEYLWLYDEELMQASAKPMDAALGNAPIMLLTNVRPLTDDFEVAEAGKRENLDWIELTPLVQDTEFHKIQIGLDQKGVKKMELHDHFSQKTMIEFVDLQTNVTFSPGWFKFVAAEGVDVVGYPGSE